MPDDDGFATPIQVKIDPFSIVLSPTNNARPLSLVDTEIILGILEDLITDYARTHYHGDEQYNEPDDTTTTTTTTTSRNTPKESDVQFKYAILGLVSIPTHPEEHVKYRETTALDFSGGIAYFSTKNAESGGVVEVPSSAEMELLVALALSEENDLVKALQVNFPYVTKATLQWQGELELINTESMSENENNPNENEKDIETQETALIMGPNVVPNSAQQQQQPATNTSSFKNSTLLIVLVCTVGATLVVGTLVVVKNRRQSVELWRSGQDKTAVNNIALDKPEDDDCNILSNGVEEDDDSEMGAGGGNKTKSQSLHLRDSLRDCSRLLMTTTTAATEEPQESLATNIIVNNGNHSDEERGSGTTSGATTLNRSGSRRAARTINDTVDLSVNVSNFSSSFIGDIVQDQSYAGRQRRDVDSSNRSSNQGFDDDDEDALTCPSDFEGNAFVEPNLIPVAHIDLDSDFTHDNVPNPLTPPSQVASTRSQSHQSASAQSSSMFSSSLSFLYPQPPPPPPTRATQQESAPQDPHADQEPNPQEGFVLSRLMSGKTGSILPMASWGLSYFGGAAQEEDDPNIDSDALAASDTKVKPSPAKTHATTDASKGWSSEGEGYKTDDDNFTLDKAWDPDDNSMNSSQNETDVFSGIEDDEVRLLKSTMLHSDAR
ncbi:expressed unknown protein [Seminavis robusta]|uniref:Uncharacterized protein n=1 Tax=Seminavis robusta TaxID=568900 RepID=A0A9N8E317_9STRA|nr:expressed unknown protein [Seminavis robusta]|eukprot:Sro505_g156180.1 n/a (663) ;mRNA; f:42398-44386